MTNFVTGVTGYVTGYVTGKNRAVIGLLRVLRGFVCACACECIYKYIYTLLNIFNAHTETYPSHPSHPSHALFHAGYECDGLHIHPSHP